MNQLEKQDVGVYMMAMKYDYICEEMGLQTKNLRHWGTEKTQFRSIEQMMARRSVKSPTFWHGSTMTRLQTSLKDLVSMHG